MRLIFTIMLGTLILQACGGTSGLQRGNYPPVGKKDDFILCHGYGCSVKTAAYFTPQEWKALTKLFKNDAPNAAEERERIGEALARMEAIIGPRTRTEKDLARTPITRDKNYETQLDCIDETVNTDRYLRFLAAEGFLKFHKLGRPVFRGNPFKGFYPHNSASLIELETDEIYVVDSWVVDNGEVPDIRPLSGWLKTKYRDL